MGLCASGDAQGTAQEQERDRKINAGLRKQQKQVENEDAKRMLLLGAGQSGKSTLFKQTQLLYGKKLAKEEMESYIPIIIGNTISSMQTLVEKSEEFAREKKDGKEKYEHKCPKEADIVKDSDRESLDAELGEAIATLWKDPGIQATFTEKHEFQLIDSASYYFGKVRQIADDKWFPDEEDVLRSRARTTGIVTTEFVVQEHHFKMFDVGGQKSERKKWEDVLRSRARTTGIVTTEFVVQEHHFKMFDVGGQKSERKKWEDVLRSRARTTGIVTTEFVVQEHHFKMFDVGGQKKERKKWVPFFEGVDCVLFVAAISGYNKTLFEDGKTNRMEDAMDLFEKTVKEKMLEKSSLVLFLNKSDLFQEEIKRFPITSWNKSLLFRKRTSELFSSIFSFTVFSKRSIASSMRLVLPFFEGVDCVLFVAAISGYNKTLFEDGKTNRMEDAMDLFEKTVKEKMLEKSSLVLFLNKSDLFQEEIKRFPITSCPRLADYTGDHSYKDTTNFIKEKFEKLVPPTRDCTIHITCATDRHNIKVVFDSVREHVLNESLAAAGLTQTMMQ
eukprot:CAMPEP_0167832372 /NCGR_PEP_ID=MMETSP0112_2-20121227/14293_1 /TAXON_ID=91324 /ORGANISM="Lotharella globosa, Strain CCCM811" /LENGTH=556 /DNA_ID=CAMNT_0007737399 /DNA_START=34 /DNA_END=1705 /DNA_ORIENTATION=-